MGSLSDNYEIGALLGTGAFSEVKVGKHKKTGRPYAIKIIDKAKCKGKESMIASEVAILKRVLHKNIVPLYEMYETDKKLYLVMKLVKGGELFDRIIKKGHYSERETAIIVRQILQGVLYLHNLGIAHRDLKPENLLFADESTDSIVMISDFGLSKIFTEEQLMKTACGTPGYVAPEVLRRHGYDKEVDLWSIGVITYILLCGYPPFYEERNAELFAQIMRGEYQFDSPYWDNVSMEAKDFIRHMLVVDPKQRIDAPGALRHRFLTRYRITEKESTEHIDEDLAFFSAVNDIPLPTLSAQVEAMSISDDNKPKPENKAPPPPPPPSDVKTEPAKQSPPPPLPETKNETKPPTSEKHGTKEKDEKGRKDKPPSTPIVAKYAKKDSAGILQVNRSDAAKAAISKDDVSTPTPPKSKKKISANLKELKLSRMSNEEIHEQQVAARLGASVRILSYNIFLRPPGVKNNTSDYKDARLMRFATDVLPNYDIIALQEMFAYGSNRLSKLTSLARKEGFNYFSYSPPRGLLNGMIDGGLVIISRYPFLKTANITFKRGVHSDRFAAKGALYTKIDVGDKHYLHLFTCHLQASYEANPPLKDLSVLVRFSQVASLREFIDNQLKENYQQGDQILLAGDLNINSRGGKDPHGRIISSAEYNALIKILSGEGVRIDEIDSSKDEVDLICSVLSSEDKDVLCGNFSPMKVVDILKEKYMEHPVTFGDIDKSTNAPLETVLTHKNAHGGCECLDYILQLTPARNPEESRNTTDTMLIDISDSKVEPLHVKDAPFTQLSDHYGVSVILRHS